MKVRNVLVFPGSTEVGLEINEALRQCKEIRLIGAGTAEPSHGPFAFSSFHVLPSIHEPEWVPALIELCQRLQIDYIFPAYDDIIVALAQEQHRIPATVITSPIDVCELTRSKRKTYLALGHLVRVPEIFNTAPARECFPVFLKPDRGQGSQGARKINDQKELEAALGQDLSRFIVTEYLPGDEYTVDCFSDRDHGVLFSRARQRTRMRNGIAVSTTTIHLPEAQVFAEKIQSRLPMRGAWFFQIKRALNGELVLLEVAPRIAGSMSAHRVLGINFPLLSIFEHERLPIKILLNQYEVHLDRALQNRYRHTVNFSSLYIDLDDTIIVRDKVNLDAIYLIFQAKNNGARVTLITKHAGDLSSTLKRYSLDSLFDEIIHLKPHENKSKFINGKAAIFIDDSFSERIEVSSACGIPTFDCSMIELLTGTPPNQ